MATLEEEFLADLEDSDTEVMPPPPPRASEEATATNEEDLMDEDDEEDARIEEMFKKANSVDNVGKLLFDPKFEALVQTVEQLLPIHRGAASWQGNVEHDPEYAFIVESNRNASMIDDEILVIHRFVAEHYGNFFPDLDTVVLHPLDYLRVVQRIGNQTDIQNVDLKDLLNHSTTMVVAVMASSKVKKPLPEDEFKEISEAVSRGLQLEEKKLLLLKFVESRMMFLAPNVSKLVGTSIAAKLIGSAGGLAALASIPSCNLQILGKKKKILSGFSTSSVNMQKGFIYECDLVNDAPHECRRRAMRVIGSKVTLAARIDTCHQDTMGVAGSKFKAEIEKKIEKWQEPPPARKQKALPAPVEPKKTKRGGKRIRRIKEKYGMTEMRKQANRVAFGQSESGDSMMGKGLGMIGASGSGKVKLEIKTKIKAKKMDQRSGLATSIASGLASSVAFTPSAGIELENPNAKKEQELREKEKNAKYFSSNLFAMKKK